MRATAALFQPLIKKKGYNTTCTPLGRPVLAAVGAEDLFIFIFFSIASW